MTYCGIGFASKKVKNETKIVRFRALNLEKLVAKRIFEAKPCGIIVGHKKI
jgi:hypothetical protein